MKAKLTRVEPGNPYYFTQYHYQCIECGAEYTRHQCNERISPYCGKCQRKHDTEVQRQRNINLKNKLIIEELKKIKAEIEKLEYDDFDCNLVLPAWKVYDIIDNHIEELKGGK